MAECISDFIRAVQDGKPPAVSGEDALKTLQITLAAYESHTSGKVVKIHA
jgi:predicted dehydrogenase